MTYEDFEKFVREQCMYETIYDDSDGRPILVIRLLDAYGMVNKAIEAEREACAQVCDEKVTAEYATGKVDHNEIGWTQACAFAIRERGAP